ncbi:1369_t:CDS:1, partial [Racocetra persica]
LLFCEECYNQFIRNTPLSLYIRNDGIFIGNCDFSPDIKKQWSAAVSENKIEEFKKFVEPKLGRIRRIQSRQAELQVSSSLEAQRKDALVRSQFIRRGQGFALELIGNGSDRYSFNGQIYTNRGAAEAAQIQIQINNCSEKLNDHLNEMRQLAIKRANFWYNL